MNYDITWRATRSLLSTGVRDDWFDTALDYLKRTHDPDGWRVMMYGC